MAADNQLNRGTADAATRDTVANDPARNPAHAAALNRVVDLLVEADSLRSEAARLLGPLADSGLAQWLGYVSMERLVAHQTRSRNSDARSLLRVARFLEANPRSAAAVQDGRLSWANAKALAFAAADDRSGRFAEHEDQLIAAATATAPEEFDRLVDAWRSRVDTELDGADAARSWRKRSLTMQLAFDGSSHGRFRLDPVATEVVAAALETPPDPAHTLPEPRTLAQRRADALVELCHSPTPGSGARVADARATGGRNAATVDVVVDVETLAGADSVTVEQLRQELGSGRPIGGPGLDRLLCDASFRALITDGPRTVLAYNRATPDIPPGLRRAIRIRDRHCTFPGCDRPHSWCDLHHIVPRNRNGPTTAENLTLLCRFHHTTVHEGGWQLTRAPDGAIQVNSP